MKSTLDQPIWSKLNKACNMTVCPYECILKSYKPKRGLIQTIHNKIYKYIYNIYIYMYIKLIEDP